MTLDDLQNFWGSRDPKLFLKRLLLHVLVGFVLGTIGPYDSDQLSSVLLRFGYWIGLVVFGSLISGPIARAFFPWFKRKSSSVKLAFVAFCAVMSVPMLFTILILDLTVVHIIFEEMESLSITEALLHLLEMPFGFVGYLLLYGQVFIISVMAFGAAVMLAANTQKAQKKDSVQPIGYRFLSRLPKEIGQNLLCLSMEDHYVRAHTDKGDALILMRMADAIKELEDYAGTQVHRSWWVSYSAILKMGKVKRRHFVHLINGMDVPVSQTHIGKLEEQGFI